MFTLAGRLGFALRVGLVAVLMVLLLPVAGYTRTFARLSAENHPLRSIGRCLDATVARLWPGGQGPGIWVEADRYAHYYYYYFHGVGPWQRRDGNPSDPTVAMHLYVPSEMSPVFLSTTRYTEFLEARNTRGQDLLERVARKAGIDVATAAADAGRAYVTVVLFEHEVLLLPGPFSSCAAEARR